MKQTIIWTALPNGVTEKAGKRYLSLAVFVSPRLESNPSNPTLEPFDFLEWPKVELDFEVEFGTGQKVVARRLAPMPDLDLWKAIFKPSTYVKPYQYENLIDQKINSFSVKKVASFIKDKYVKIATDAKWSLQKPAINQIHQIFQPIVRVIDNPAAIEQQLQPLIRAAGPIAAEARVPEVSVAAKLNKPEVDFHLVQKFYARPKAEFVPAPLQLDFHQVCAMLCQYPEINQRMGLVINLEVPLNKHIPASSRLRIRPVWRTNPKVTPVEQRPWTQYILKNTVKISDAMFIAAPRPVNPEIKDGYLIIQNPASRNGANDPCHVEIMDIDGLSLKLLNTLGSINHVIPKGTLPKVKTAGVAAKQPEQVQPKYDASLVPPDLSLPAMRSAGISLVRNGRAEWLQKRFLAMNLIYQKASSNEDLLLYAEDLVRGYRIDVWDKNTQKWHSLHRRKGIYSFLDTGQKLEFVDEGFVQTGATKSEDASSKEIYIHECLARWDGWSLSAPRPGLTITPDGKLAEEKVEAGEDYRLETEFKVQPGTLPKLRYGTEYFLRARAVDLAGNSVPFKETQTNFTAPTNTRRIIYARFEPIPSPAVVQLQEAKEGDSIERVVVRSNYDTAPGMIEPAQRHIAPPQTSQIMAETHGKFDIAKGMNKTAYDIIARREGAFESQDGRQIPHPELNLELPYLPDPMAAGASFFGLPGTNDVVRVPFAGKNANWLDVVPFRLKVVGIEANDPRLPKHASPGSPRIISENSRPVLVVQLPKAEIVKIKLSCYLNETYLQQMGIWQWLSSTYGTAYLNAWKQQALQGRLWIIEPYREITLVHAVQKPLIAPSLNKLSANKVLGATYATLSADMDISGKSTSEVGISAEWADFTDDTRKETWEKIPVKTHVCDVPVTANDTKLRINQNHEFGDTKYRKVSYTATATSRFKEYFPTGTDLTRKSSTVVRHVLNSARPDAPKLMYVIPTFGWGSGVSSPKPGIGSSLTLKRTGGGLRVYMERPWFSSGEGELLGVVLRHGPEPGEGLKDPLKPYVTQWGKDPIWKTNPVYEIPSALNFRKSVNNRDNLSVIEVPGASVSVAGHQVKFDDERKLWYADLQIDAGNSYYPFIRLALARYQPNSVNHAHLSRIVQADFAQLAPDRTATVSYSSSLSIVTVTVSGLTYNVSGVPGKPCSEMFVTVETQSNAALEDLGWVEAKTEKLDRFASFWQKKISLPSPRGSMPMRLVIKEMEYYECDPNPDTLQVANVPGVASRLVFAGVLYV